MDPAPPQPESPASPPAVLDRGEDAPVAAREPYWWVPLATVVGFLAVANYVWISFL